MSASSSVGGADSDEIDERSEESSSAMMCGGRRWHCVCSLRVAVLKLKEEQGCLQERKWVQQ